MVAKRSDKPDLKASSRASTPVCGHSHCPAQPSGIAAMTASAQGTAVSHLGIEFLSVGPDSMTARMPVDARTRQPKQMAAQGPRPQRGQVHHRGGGGAPATAARC